MNEQFNFTPAGVQEWQDILYAQGQAAVDDECTMISADFVAWASYRFSFAPEQTAFLEALGYLVHESYSAAIQDALQHRGPITLEKPDTDTARARIKNPKVIAKEQRNRTNRVESRTGAVDKEEIEQEVTLAFRISYPEEN